MENTRLPRMMDNIIYLAKYKSLTKAHKCEFNIGYPVHESVYETSTCSRVNNCLAVN